MNLVRFSDQHPSVFDRFFDNSIFDWNNRHFSETNTTLPSVNVKENTDEFLVEVAAPGFDKKDFNIEIDNDVLTISSEKKDEIEEKEGEKITKREFSYQSFSRSFTLPVLVERDKINAKYEKGILRIAIPKKEEAKPKPAKRIKIS
ncbi:MAG: Hsp20/alpha crystallin family protein [Bacteroidales bacterium]|nr:Hsp20/alpha crystallin family protein [Bacteroidales bacterium]RLD35688.1 MAG: Hsp20/alpha crystallin family protein [Bacteroidota bacterium]